MTALRDKVAMELAASLAAYLDAWPEMMPGAEAAIAAVREHLSEPNTVERLAGMMVKYWSDKDDEPNDGDIALMERILAAAFEEKS